MFQLKWENLWAFMAAIAMCICLGLTIIKGIAFVVALVVFMACADTTWRGMGL